MPDYFLTFMAKSMRADEVQRIEAPDYPKAREVAFHHYGPRWAFLYEDEPETANMIRRYKLQETHPPLVWLDKDAGVST